MLIMLNPYLTYFRAHDITCLHMIFVPLHKASDLFDIDANVNCYIQGERLINNIFGQLTEFHQTINRKCYNYI